MSVSTGCRLNRPHVARDGGPVTAAVTVDPGERETDRPRHVAVCLDTSGSMGDGRLAAAREGVVGARDRLDDDDVFAAVAFDDEVRPLLAATQVGDLRDDEVSDRLADLHPDGGTDLHAGVSRAARELRHLPGRGAVKRLVVMTDGTGGSHDPAAFTRIGREADAAGVRVVAAGFGDDYDERPLRALADASRGEWRHLDEPSAATTLVPRVVDEADDVVAPDARLDLAPGPGVDVDAVHRALPRAGTVDAPDGGVVPLPDLRSGERQRVYLRLAVPAGEAGETPLVTVRLRADGASGIERPSVERTDDQERLATHEPSVTLGRIRSAARAHLGAGEIDEAARLVERAARAYGEDAVADLVVALRGASAGSRAARQAAVRGVVGS